VTNGGTSDYNALQVQFQRRLSRGLQVLASYTWSHSIDTGSAGSLLLPANIFAPSSANRAASDFDIRHAMSGAVTYDIPVPKLNAFTNVLFRGWSTENFIVARSAPPVDIADANFFEFNQFAGDPRPDLVPGQPLYFYGSQYPGGKAFNPAAFTSPPIDPSTGNPVRQGTVPRNFLRGFGAAQWDCAVHRDFPIHESLKLQFRAEMFNVLNHPNFGPPNGQFGTGGFGLSTQMLGQYFNGGTSGSSNLGGGAFSTSVPNWWPAIDPVGTQNILLGYSGPGVGKCYVTLRSYPNHLVKSETRDEAIAVYLCLIFRSQRTTQRVCPKRQSSR